MPAESNQERTEPATQRRREQAKEKGQVAKSTEINTVFIFVFSLLYFSIAGNFFYKNIKEIVIFYLSNAGNLSIDMSTYYNFMLNLLEKVGLLLLPYFLIIFVAGIIANVIQFGFLFTAQPLTPDLKKINPISGFSRIFSKKSFVELIKSILKIITVVSIAFLTIRANHNQLILNADKDISQIATVAIGFIKGLSLKILLALIIIAIFDFAFARWDYEQNLKMTKQEVKEELKQYEGDPLIKSRIRSIQREMARKRMLQKVPEAEVVITNPTHFAIALAYDMEKDPAPKVIAKGADFIAQKIKEIATENDVPIVENKSLARALYKACEIGDFIPEDLYTAVAEVLSYVYKLKGKKVA